MFSQILAFVNVSGAYLMMNKDFFGKGSDKFSLKILAQEGETVEGRVPDMAVNLKDYVDIGVQG